MRYLTIIAIIIFVFRFHLPPPVSTLPTPSIGVIASIPEHSPHALQFLFVTEHPAAKLWVSWYAPPPVTLMIGDAWQLALTLKPANTNWLYAQHINAVATVAFNYNNQLLMPNYKSYPIATLRQRIYFHLQQVLVNNPGLGFISALSIGMRDQITTQQWQDLRGTGTNHLMAIAGLHIGFIAAIFYTLSNFIWRRFSLLMLYMPAQDVGLIGSLSGAMLYSALAGFALPTQRALIMLSVFILTRLLRANINLWTSWWLALLIILVYEPLAVLTASFWLSFSAVGLLIYANGARLNAKQWWWHWGRAQWVMTLGLIPLGLLFFQQVSLISFIANVIAIPIVGFVIVPLCFLADISGIGFFWKIAAFLLMHFWPLIHYLATLPHSQWFQTINNPGLIFTSTIAILLLLAPRGVPRWLGLIWLLPLLTRH